MQLMRWLAACAAALLLASCATQLPDHRISRIDADGGYRRADELRRVDVQDPDTLLLVAFSGGGVRASAFSYGVLEELRRTAVPGAGAARPLLGEIDAISSVSGGTFTALAYALYGDRLFDVFEPRFLKRDVQGELLNSLFNPLNWPSLLFSGYDRSDLAARHYDDILFDGATYADLVARPGPLVVASSTDFSTGARVTFTQDTFDLLCTDLSTFRLSLAATASSAVPVVFAPVTLRNWGGTCGVKLPAWAVAGAHEGATGADATLLRLRLQGMLQLQDGAARPWLHLVDGGVSDNLGLRAFIDLLQALRLRPELRTQLGLDQVRRVAVIVVNALSVQPSDWGRSELGPGIIETVLQSASVPIDRESTDSIVLLQSMIERWRLEAALERVDPAARFNVPVAPLEFFPILLSFDRLADPAERAFFNSVPTSLALPAETIDRLRAVGGTLLRESPEFRAFLRSYEAPAALRPAAPTR